MSMVDDILAMAVTWTERFAPKNNSNQPKKFQNALAWATYFTHCQKRKKLNS